MTLKVLSASRVWRRARYDRPTPAAGGERGGDLRGEQHNSLPAGGIGQEPDAVCGCLPREAKADFVGTQSNRLW